MVGTSYILENAKIRKRAGFWRDRNLFHVRQSHCSKKFLSTLENLLSRDIVSICYYSHILMKSAVLREFKIWSGAFPFFRCPPHWKPKIYVPAGQAADCLEFLAMFWKCFNRSLPSSKNPHFQNEARCTIFLVKMSFICIADHLPSFWNRGPGELGNSLLSLLPLLVFRFLVALLTHPSSLLFLISRAFSSSRHSSSSSFRCLPRPLPLWLPCLSIVISL